MLAERGSSGVHRYLTTEAGRTHVLEVGAGEPLIFLHGLGASAGSYVALIGALGRHRRVIAIDRPGSGLSDQVRFKGHPRPAWNSVISSVAEKFELDRFDMVGHSMGGLAAGGFAVDNPNRVRKLVLLAPVGLASRLPAIWAIGGLPGVMDLVGTLDQFMMASQVARGYTDIRGITWGPVQVGSDRHRYQYLIGRRFSKGSDLDSFPGLMTITKFRPESLLLPGLGLFSGRTLVIWGDRDDLVPAAPAQAELSSYPGIELAMLPMRGHLFPFTEPLRTEQMIQAFLTGATV
jgi:pimeloyl-ACP methyl ester carboxylesterase